MRIDMSCCRTRIKKNLFQFSKNERNLQIKCAIAVYSAVKCHNIFSEWEN